MVEDERHICVPYKRYKHMDFNDFLIFFVQISIHEQVWTEDDPVRGELCSYSSLIRPKRVVTCLKRVISAPIMIGEHTGTRLRISHINDHNINKTISVPVQYSTVLR